jgi:hypothetical protein
MQKLTRPQGANSEHCSLICGFEVQSCANLIPYTFRKSEQEFPLTIVYMSRNFV